MDMYKDTRGQARQYFAVFLLDIASEDQCSDLLSYGRLRSEL